MRRLALPLRRDRRGLLNKLVLVGAEHIRVAASELPALVADRRELAHTPLGSRNAILDVAIGLVGLVTAKKTH
jgi:hypothetical protein